MEWYDECPICGKWDDLTNWRSIVYICMDCFGVLDKRAPFIQGRFHLSNTKTYEMIREEMRHGK